MTEEFPTLEPLEGDEVVPRTPTNGAEILAGLNSIHADHYYTAAEGGIENVLNKEIVITAIAERNSGFARQDGTKGKFFAVGATIKDKKGKQTKIGFNTGSNVLIESLQKLQPYFPCTIVIEKIAKEGGRRYYQVKQ